MTYQRQLILGLFKTSSEGCHLSAEEIHHILFEQGTSISLSTVYRTLHVMVTLGLLRELELANDKKFYELSSAIPDQHHHLVCVHCGSIQEFAADIITQVGTGQSEIRGYTVLDFQFTIQGICPQCQKGEQP